LTTWPKVYSGAEAPREVLDLTATLMPQLLSGEHSSLGALRAQYARCSISRVELTGVGFFVSFAVPDDVERCVPAEVAGGDAVIGYAESSIPAGCVLFVRDGLLRELEIYTFDSGWPEHATVTSVTDVMPLPIGEYPGWR
jgi:hypothetical protein